MKYSRILSLALISVIASVASYAAAIFSEDFSAPLGAAWTAVDSGGPINMNVANGVATLGPLDSATAVNGETAYIKRSVSNATTQYAGYSGSFTCNFTGLSFVPSATNGNNSITLFKLMPTSGNNKLADLRFEIREWNNDYNFVSANGIQFSGTGAVIDTKSFSTATLQALSNVKFAYVINFVNNGALNWTVSTDWTITDENTSTVLTTLKSTITANSANSDFNPLTGSNEVFQFGVTSYDQQFNAPQVTGNLVMDNITVSGIPEPGAYALILAGGIAGLVILFRRRRA
ncbi:MAG: PEP-CTERM sorting domain-containing protein [Verrucomicrobiota bacterium]|nr:PEP-CTERM sorting domain-containing protein [Verrucomicrobiota bacterium]